MYVINTGRVDIVKRSPDGDIVIVTLGQGEIFGKMALVVTGVWGIERSAKNRRRVTPSPVAVRRSQPKRLAMPASRERFLPRPALELIRRADG